MKTVIPIHTYSSEVDIQDIARMLKEYADQVKRLERTNEDLKSANDQYYQRIKELEGILDGKERDTTQSESGTEEAGH